MAESRRERSMKIIPAWRSNCGWGEPGSEHSGVHFKSFIASSLGTLEQYALQRDGALHACGGYGPVGDRGSESCDVDEYMGRIRRAVPELSADLCRQYVAFYRSARTPGREFTDREYYAFVKLFLDVLRRIER